MAISRRYFLKSGGIAMLGMASLPSFLQRAVAATAGPSKKKMVVLFQRGAMDGLNVVVPFAEPNYYQLRPTIAIPAPSRGTLRCGHRSRRLLRPASQLAAFATAISEWPACDRARSRFSRSHALAFRRAGFHGIRHARREIHGRWLAESRVAGCAGRPRLPIPRCRLRTVSAAHAFRQRARRCRLRSESIQALRPAADRRRRFRSHVRANSRPSAPRRGPGNLRGRRPAQENQS